MVLQKGRHKRLEKLEMKRLLACGLLLTWGLAAYGQDLTKKISVEIPASRTSAALAALSKAAGVTFEPAANLRAEVLVVSVHDVTVQEVMNRIAQAESGKWTLQGNTYLL